jgi:hypothetical protein
MRERERREKRRMDAIVGKVEGREKESDREERRSYR